MKGITYKIKIEYSTGDSFDTYDEVDVLEFNFKNVETAIENINRISQHYHMYRDLNGYFSSKSRDRILEENKSKPWFNSNSERSIYLLLDDGKNVCISAFWCGYFERLNNVEVIIDNSSLKIEF